MKTNPTILNSVSRQSMPVLLIFFMPSAVAAFDGSAPETIQPPVANGVRLAIDAVYAKGGARIAGIQDNPTIRNEATTLSRTHIVGALTLAPAPGKANTQTEADSTSALSFALSFVNVNNHYLAREDNCGGTGTLYPAMPLIAKRASGTKQWQDEQRAGIGSTNTCLFIKTPLIGEADK